MGRHRFRDLVVWKRGMDWVAEIYRLTQDFPQHELFALTSQLRRAASSVPLNIAEGSASDSSKEFRRFLNIALGSIYEAVTAFEIAFRLGYSDRITVNSLLDEADQIAAMIVGLAKHLEQKPQHSTIREVAPSYFAPTRTNDPDHAS